MLKKLQIKLNHLRFIGLMVFGILSLHHHGYSQKRISSEGNVSIVKHMNIEFDRTKAVTLPKRSTVTQEVTVTLNDGSPEFWYNPRQFFGDGSGKNGATDYFLVIFEPGDFAAYGVQFPMRITGVSFINNDDQTTWREVSIYPLQGDRSSWSIDGSALAVRNNVTPQVTGWATVNFASPPTVDQSTTLAVFILFPQGTQLTGEGSSGGPAIAGDTDGTDDPSYPPAGIQARNRNSWVSIDGTNAYWLQHSDGLPINLVVNLIVEPIGAPDDPDIAVNPLTHDYGNVVIGTSLSHTYEVSNQGTADLHVTSTTLVGTDAGQFSIDAGGGSFTLSPGATQNIEVSFSPISGGTKSANLQIVSDDPDEATKDVLLSGSGEVVGGVTIFPSASSPQSAGSEFWVDVLVGDATNPVSDLFRVDFTLNYTQTGYIDVVTPHSSHVIAGSFPGSNPIFTRSVNEIAGEVDITISRNAGAGGVDGSGALANVHFVTQVNTPDGSNIDFTITNITATDPNGTGIPLNPQSLSVTVQSGVTVWPGDTDNDGEVDQADILPIGMYWENTGPVRDDAFINWNGESATPWSNQAATFGDANGDGIIDQSDILPIGFNWGRTHTAASLLTEDETASGKLQGLLSSKLILGINGDTHPDQEFWVEVRVEEVANLFGIAFDVVYAPTTYVDPQTVEPGIWMGTDVIFYPNIDKNIGRISIGITRKAGQTNVDGSGMVARIKMKMLASASIGDVTNLTLENVAAIDSSGNAITFSVMNQSIVTSIEGRGTVEIPVAFDLAQNVPNPFNPETHIRYDLPTSTPVRIDIFNMLGRKIRTLVDEEKPAGSFNVIWDGRMDNGKEAVSGVYIYFMKTKAYTKYRKLLLLR